MANQTISKKRKSTDGATIATKKARIAKSADKPAPLKSALKKSSISSNEDQNELPDKQPPTVTEKSIVEDNDVNGGTNLTPSQTAALLAGFSSSDEEDSADERGGIPISTLPKPPSKGLIKKRINQSIAEQNDPETTPGVIYIGRIPHGFFEYQMKAYFSQFGEMNHLKLARSKKTGRSQGYAFVEFASAAVADIVAKTMDKYLLFGHILQVRRVPREQINENMWKGGRSRRKPEPRNKIEGGKLRRGATRELWQERVEREERRRKEKMEKLKEMGYEFEMPELRSVGDVPVKEKVDEDVADVGAEVDEGVKLLQNGSEAEARVESAQEGEAVVEEAKIEPKVPKKRSAHGKTQEKKVVKKPKT